MTKEQILKATGGELSRLAGEVLTPGPYYHNHKSTNVDGESLYFCGWCHAGFKNKPRLDATRFCPKGEPNPIPLTWPEAMKWRDWAVKEFGHIAWRKALVDVYCEVVNDITTSFDEWLCSHITAEHYIKAAALCKLGKEL